jgi:hypothetical protein
VPEPFVPAALRGNAATTRTGNSAGPGIAAGLIGFVALLRPRLRRPDVGSLLLRLRPSPSLRQP